jgi:hypothetical protein
MNEVHAREHSAQHQQQQQQLMNGSNIKELEHISFQYPSFHNVINSTMKEIIRFVFISPSSSVSASSTPTSVLASPLPSTASSMPNTPSSSSSSAVALSHLMKIDKKLLHDRIDAIANVLIVYLVYNFSSFQEIVNDIINQQVLSVKQLLIQYLQTLLTDRHLSIHSIQKKNRLIFVQNFRDFYLQIKNLTVR